MAVGNIHKIGEIMKNELLLIYWKMKCYYLKRVYLSGTLCSSEIILLNFQALQRLLRLSAEKVMKVFIWHHELDMARKVTPTPKVHFKNFGRKVVLNFKGQFN